MATTTPKGYQYPAETDTVTVYPALNQSNALLEDARPGVSVVTTTQMNAYSGTDLWDGRIVWNTTASALYRYNLSTTSWVIANNVNGATLTGNTLINPILTGAIEDILITNTSLSGVENINAAQGSAWYFAGVTAATFTLNLTTTATISALLGIGQSMTFVVLATQGATGYALTGIQIDGVTGGFASGSTAGGTTTFWQGGAAPTVGNANGIDAYTFTVIKVAATTYTVLASQVKF